MSDIVHWLRKLAALVEADHAPQHVVMHMRAGADEIERLRAGGCARDQGTTQYCAEAAKKDAEIANLLNLLADARTESMKLRAALEPFAKVARVFDEDVRSNNTPRSGAWYCWAKMVDEKPVDYILTVEHMRAARAALEGK